MASTKVFLFLMTVIGLGVPDLKHEKCNYGKMYWSVALVVFLLFGMAYDLTLYLHYYTSRMGGMDFSALAVGVYRCYIILEAVLVIFLMKATAAPLLSLLSNVQNINYFSSTATRKNFLLLRVRFKKQRASWEFYGAVLIVWSCVASLVAGAIQIKCFWDLLHGTNLANASPKNWTVSVKNALWGSSPFFFYPALYTILYFVCCLIDMLPQMLCVWCTLITGSGFIRIKNKLKSLDLLFQPGVDTEAVALKTLDALAEKHLALSRLVEQMEKVFSTINLLVYARDFLGFLAVCSLAVRTADGIPIPEDRVAGSVDKMYALSCEVLLMVSLINSFLRTYSFITMSDKGKLSLRPLMRIFEHLEHLHGKMHCTVTANRIRGSSLAISASGFFPIDRTFVVTMLGSFFTFFILVYQMQDQKKDIYSVISKKDISKLGSAVLFALHVPTAGVQTQNKSNFWS